MTEPSLILSQLTRDGQFPVQAQWMIFSAPTGFQNAYQSSDLGRSAAGPDPAELSNTLCDSEPDDGGKKEPQR